MQTCKNCHCVLTDNTGYLRKDTGHFQAFCRKCQGRITVGDLMVYYFECGMTLKEIAEVMGYSTRRTFSYLTHAGVFNGLPEGYIDVPEDVNLFEFVREFAR